MARPRLRALGIAVGTLSPGPHNAITDVPGVWVGHTTVIRDEPRVARTGVTMVVPRENHVWDDYCFAGHFSFTGNGWLNDIAAFTLTEGAALAARRAAAPGPVAEGNVGGGTGMICHEFKGGIGTASRLCRAGGGAWTVGALGQAHYGDRADLRLDGLPLGRLIGCDRVPCAYPEEQDPGGSIIVVVATDAPLIPTQCARLARPATVGPARVGGGGR